MAQATDAEETETLTAAQVVERTRDEKIKTDRIAENRCVSTGLSIFYNFKEINTLTRNH